MSNINNPVFFIEWSEFHYHLFSHLMSEHCPRELAEGLDLAIFQEGPAPNRERMEECVLAMIDSDGPEDANVRLTRLLVKWTD